MSIDLMQRAQRDPLAEIGRRRRATANSVLRAIAWHFNDETGRCDPSIRTLQRETLLSRACIMSALRLLEECGRITRLNRSGRTTCYLVTPAEGGSATDEGGPSPIPDPSTAHTQKKGKKLYRVDARGRKEGEGCPRRLEVLA